MTEIIFPKISIITTFYNSVKLGDFVHRAMKSLLNQTYENIEFICVNDGSTDETLAHLKDYEKKDPRIIIINKKNEGVAQYAKAAGQDTASGDYIMLFDHDDQISHYAIENAINALSKNPDSDAVSMLVKTYYADGRVRNTYNLFEKISNLDNFKSVSIKGTDAYQLTVGRYDFHFRGLISKDKFKAISFRFPEKLVNGDEIIERQIFKSLDKIISCKGIYHHYIYDNSSAKSYNLKKTDFVKTDIILREIFKKDGVYENRKEIFEFVAYKNLTSAIKVYHHYEKKIQGNEKDFYKKRLKEGFIKIEKKTLLKQYKGISKWYNYILCSSFFTIFWFYKIKG